MIDLKKAREIDTEYSEVDVLEMADWIEETNKLLFQAAWCAWNDGQEELCNKLQAQYNKIEQVEE